MKVFVIAFACEPDRTSEPGVGWHLVGELAQRHELTVLTRCNNRSIIEKWLARPENQKTGKSYFRIQWRYYELPEWFHKLKKHLPGGIQLYQEIWQYGAARSFAATLGDYDVVHHLTFGSVFFTPWAARYSKRFIWGPIGGATGAMEGPFLKNESWRSRLSEMFYRLVSWYSFHPMPWAGRCRQFCAAVLFRTSELARLATFAKGKYIDVIGEAAYPHPVVTRKYAVASHPLNVVCVGRLIPLKGVKYAIAAFARFCSIGGRGTLYVYGDGPLRRELECLAARLQVSDRVVFQGNVPNDQVLIALSKSDVLIHASFREGVSWTILEAMAHGVPVICQDRAGMRDVVTDLCGQKIAAATPNELIEKMSVALQAYMAEPALVERQGLAAQARIRGQYQWHQVAERIDAAYQEVAK